MTLKQLKKSLLKSQKNKCAWCLRGDYCAACENKLPHNGKCRKQKIDTLDHNHIHKGCGGCEKCARGMVHMWCNRNSIASVERNPHLQSTFAKKYLKKGNR